MSERRPLRALLLACALAPGLATAAGAPAGPRQIIEQTAEQVLAVLRDPALTREQRLERLERIAYARFDFRTMTRLVLARDWKKLSAAQQDDFVEQFRRYLANDYGSRIDRYEQQDVSVLEERAEPRGDVTVKTVISGGEVDGAIVDYRLRQADGEWRIIDVVVEGISLVANFRDQFREVLAREGPEHLLARLREKNAASDGAAAAADGLALPAEDWNARPASAARPAGTGAPASAAPGAGE